MALVNIRSINVLNNQAPFTDSYLFEIVFECSGPLKNDLEWTLTYVGSATSQNYDQVLDSSLVGPVPEGFNKFVFEGKAPDIDRIPDDDILGVTVILISCAYNDKEFVRVGYYVNNEWHGTEDEAIFDESGNRVPPPGIKIKNHLNNVRRNILSDKPRVTRFNIPWDNLDWTDEPPEKAEGDNDDGDSAIDVNDLEDEEDEDEVDEDGEDEEGASGEEEEAEVDLEEEE